MSKDLLVLADEYAAATAAFARLLALKDGVDSMSPIAREAGDKRAVLAEALAALEAAQPVQVNAGYGELEAVMSAEFESHGFGAPESNKREYGRFRVGFASGWHSALTAAKQAQPDGINDVYLKGYEAGKQAQPERAPLTDQQKRILFECVEQVKDGNELDYWLLGFEAAESAYGIKQAQPARPINCGTGHCSCIECPYKQAQPEPVWSDGTTPLVEGGLISAGKVDHQIRAFMQAQPERAPLSDDEIKELYIKAPGHCVGFARAIEAAHGIKQGGQQ